MNRRTVKDRILRRMARNPSSLYVSEIAQGAKISHDEALSVLVELQAAGRVESTWKAPNGKVVR